MKTLSHVPRLAPTVLLACSLLSAPALLLAQGGPPPGEHAGGRHGPGGGRRMMDPMLVQGPPKPEEMVTIAGLDQAQTARYATMYTNLMAGTRQDRDSLKALREARRQDAAPSQAGDDRGAGREGMKAFEDLRNDLERQQRGFDEALKDVLAKDQLRKYQQWREDQRKEMRDRMHGEHDGGPPA